MAQHDYTIANQGFPAFRSDLNNALAAIVSNNSGATEPTTMFAHQMWVDTAANPSVLKIRNADNDAWITIGTINQTGDTFTLTSAVSATTLNTSGAVVFNDAGANVDFRVEGDTDASLLFVDASADKVGIGTNAPTTKLNVATTADASIYTLIQNDDTLNYVGVTSGGYATIQTNQALTFHSGASYTERMRIDSSGNLLVGTTTSLAGSSHSFLATGTTASSYAGVFKQAAVGANGRIQFWELTNTDDSSAYFLYAQNTSGNCLNIFGNGNITNTNNSYGAISDVKLKKDIVDAGSQWDDLKAIRIRKFSFKNDPDGVLQIGVIAQELEEVSSGLVSEHTDYEMVDVPVLDDEGNPVLDEEGNPTTRQEQQATGETTKSVKYSVLYMKAVKALQEAMERIETLEAKVAALENA